MLIFYFWLYWCNELTKIRNLIGSVLFFHCFCTEKNSIQLFPERNRTEYFLFTWHVRMLRNFSVPFRSCPGKIFYKWKTALSILIITASKPINIKEPNHVTQLFWKKNATFSRVIFSLSLPEVWSRVWSRRSISNY